MVPAVGFFADPTGGAGNARNTALHRAPASKAVPRGSESIRGAIHPFQEERIAMTKRILLAAAVLTSCVGAGYALLQREETKKNQTLVAKFVNSQLDLIRGSLEEQQSASRRWPMPGAGDLSQKRSGDRSRPKADSDGAASLGAPGRPPTEEHIALSPESYESRFRRIEQSKPAAESQSAGRAAALKELTSACAEFISRGSVKSYALQARIDVALESLKGLARELHVPEDSLPQNLFELLGPDTLERLHVLQVERISNLKQREVACPGLYLLAIANEESVGAQIEEARAKRTADLAAIFAEAARHSKLSRDAVSRLNGVPSESALVAAIELRESQLLAKALTADHANVAARLRYRQLLAKMGTNQLPQFPDFEIRFAVIDQIAAASPKDPAALQSSPRELAKFPSGVAEAVVRYADSRFSDPLKAAELLVLLENTYKANAASAGGSESGRDFKRWMAGHLTLGQLYEIQMLYLMPARQALAELAVMNRPDRPHPDDRADVEETVDEFSKEVAARHGRQTPQEARLYGHLKSGTAGDQEVYNALRKLSVLADGAEVRGALLSKALAGISRQIDSVDATRELAQQKISANGAAVSALKALGETGGAPREVENARTALAESYKALELRLDQLLVGAPGNSSAKSLLERVKAGLAAIPPPQDGLPNTKPAQDWADPFVGGRLKTVTEVYLPAVGASTANLSVAVSQAEARREADRVAEERRAEERRAEERRAEAEMAEILRKSRPHFGSSDSRGMSKRLVGQTDDGTKIYYLGPQSSIGRKNYEDENGTRYELLPGGTL